MENLFVIGIFAVPALLIIAFAYLARTIRKKMETGEIRPAMGALLITVCTIPAAVCGFFLVLLLGVFTGIIPLM